MAEFYNEDYNAANVQYLSTPVSTIVCVIQLKLSIEKLKFKCDRDL